MGDFANYSNVFQKCSKPPNLFIKAQYLFLVCFSTTKVKCTRRFEKNLILEEEQKLGESQIF